MRDWQEVAEHGGPVVPVLVGPTGSGKTARVRAWAEETGRELHVLLLGTMLAEDTLGLPRVRTRGNRAVTEWSLPEWALAACRRPCVVFLDELDKARPETLSTVLTLIASREVRGHALHQDTRIVAAMQPVDVAAWLADETTRAISARACFVAVAADVSWVGRRWGLDLSDFPVDDAPTLPVLARPTLRQLDWALSFLSAHADWDDDRLVDVLGGAVGSEAARQLVRRWREGTPSVTREGLLAAIDEDPSLIDRLTWSEVLDLGPETWRSMRPEAMDRCLRRLAAEGTPDDHETFVSRQFDVFCDIGRAQTGQERPPDVEVFGEATDDEVYDIVAPWQADGMLTRVRREGLPVSDPDNLLPEIEAWVKECLGGEAWFDREDR